MKLTLTLLMLSSISLANDKMETYPLYGVHPNKSTSWYQENGSIYKTSTTPIDLVIKDGTFKDTPTDMEQFANDGVNTVRVPLDLETFKENRDALEEFIDQCAEFDINVIIKVQPKEVTLNLQQLAKMTVPYPNIAGVEIERNSKTDTVAKTILDINPEILVFLTTQMVFQKQILPVLRRAEKIR
jgi:hypothetical protein